MAVTCHGLAHGIGPPSNVSLQRHFKPTVSPLLTPLTSHNILLLQSLPNSIPYRQDNVRRRKDAPRVGTAARGSIERFCIVSPDVFHQMVDRLAEFVVPYQHVLETEAGQRNVHLYLQGLLSHLPGKNAEDIATFVDVERQVIQDFIGRLSRRDRAKKGVSASSLLDTVPKRLKREEICLWFLECAPADLAYPMLPASSLHPL